MRREVARQPPVNLLVTQFFFFFFQPQWFSFDSAYLILQYLVGTKLDAFSLILMVLRLVAAVTGSVLVSTG